MAKQNQPSSSSSSYSPSSSSGGRNVDINFTDETDIIGQTQGPDDVFQSIKSETPAVAWPVADAADLKDDNGGNNGKTVVKLIEWMIQKIREFLKSEGTDFARNFAITYHNHDIPVPIPLTPFITTLDINEMHEAPYSTARINLKIPFEHIQVMFKNGGGRVDPGGFISVRQKSAPTLTDKIDNPRIKNNYFLTHLMTIENINYNVSVDQTTGTLITNLSLACGSFISPLLAGQYVVSEATNVKVKTDDIRVAKAGKQSPNDFQELLNKLGVSDNSELRNRLNISNPTGRRTEKRGDIISEFFYDTEMYNKFLQLVCDGSIIRKDSGKDLKAVLKFLGYPKLPSSVFGVFEVEKWLNEIQKELDKGAVYYIRLLRTQGVAEGKIQEIGADLLSVFDNLTRNDANQGNFKERDPLMTPIEERKVGPFDFQTTKSMPGDTTVAAELLQEELKQKNLLQGGQFINGTEQRLGDVIRVISNVNDLPAGIDTNNVQQFPWYSSLSKDVMFNENLNKVGNLYSKGQTIWGACLSTFQPDDKTHEMFPIIIPIIDDAWFNVSTDFERKLGGILAVIYRKKPMHPQIDLSANSLNKEYSKYRETFVDKLDEPYYKNITYKTNSEQLKTNQDSQDNILDTILRTGPSNDYQNDKSKEYYAGNKSMPLIPYRDVIDINFNHTNSQRVNGVQVKHPFAKTSAQGIGLLTEPYINVADASRFGLRFYESNFPFMDLSPLEQGALNEGNTTAERLYMTLGDGSKYSNGNIKLYLETTYGIKQGCWFAINFSQKADIQYNKPYRFSYFIAYCDSIQYMFNTQNNNGNIRTTTQISYSRGSWGGIIPELPAFRTVLFNTDEETKKITSPGDRRIAGKETSTSSVKPAAQSKQLQPSEDKLIIRFARDEWGSYGDASSIERRNGAFENSWAGFTPAEQTTIINKQSVEGETQYSRYYDLDDDGYYEWFMTEDGNYIFIPTRKRPAVDGYIFESIEDILGPGFTSPYPVDFKEANKTTVSNVNDDYVF